MEVESRENKEMLAVISEAIRSKHLLEIQYGLQQERVVQPHILGYSHHALLLSAYQVSGFSESHQVPSWKSFDVRKILRVRVLPEHFRQPRPEYNPQDPKFSRVLCQL